MLIGPTPCIAVAILSVVVFTFLLRLFDELKDYDDDLVNYPERPLPSGRVLFKDIYILITLSILSLIGLHAGVNQLWIPAGVVFVYCLLMFRWFFIKNKIRSSLPLALLTHHPVVPLFFVYLFLAFIKDGYTYTVYDYALIIPFSLMMTNWEIGRKVRSANLETSYVTYSQTWGLTRATVVLILIQMLVVAGFSFYFYMVQTHAAILYGFPILHLLTQLPLWIFLIKKKQTDILQWRRQAELQIGLVYLFLILDYFYWLGQYSIIQ